MASRSTTSWAMRLLAGTLLIGLPIAISFWTICIIFQSSPWTYLPRNHDETLFWIDANSFYHVGLQGGYSGFEEMLGFAPRLGIGLYGGHGFFAFFLATIIGKLIGFPEYSGINFAYFFYFAAAAIFFVARWRGRSDMLLFAALFIGSFFPFFSHLILNWQETLHVSVAIALASIFMSLISEDAHTPKRRNAFIIGFVLLLLASLLRYSWALLYLPLFLFTRKPGKWGYIRSTIAGFLMIGVCYIMYKLISAPYPYGKFGFNYLEGLFSEGFSSKHYLDYLAWNIEFFFSFERDNVHDKLLLWTMSSFVFAAPVLTYLFQNKIEGVGKNGTTAADLTLFHIINMGGLFIFSIFWYYPNTRLLAPCFLLSLVIMTSYLPSRWYYIVLVASLMLLPVNLENHRDGQTDTYPIKQEYEYLSNKYKTYGREMAKTIRYIPDSSPWCNTLMLLDWTKRDFLDVPPGIAIHFFKEPEKHDLPYKSHYIFIMNDEQYSQVTRTTKIEQLWKSDHGTLYLNLDAQCQK
ncbi:hypothetical protein [Solidesulfovibrio carbinolicus]|uniref:Laminin IV type B domain-containing protein n=1 Tax=Solidesulfovibrio carbinolicus TaxID=296842 RepID=A0A4P6HP70_9BACT|nr:hypothetical protein [Solidesulfovibrio carbinolicus]QAZ68895.1 hypothetical protein C3Y92_17310 [Solidesulfovibrio carbinolicus]